MIPFLNINPTGATAVANQIRSGFVGPGETTRAFETKLSEILGVPHVIATTSGTVALSIAALSSGLKPGDEILVPAYGVTATTNAFRSMGLRVRLVDIRKSTGCMDASALLRAIDEITRAVCFVDFGGNLPNDIEIIKDICEDRKLIFIEDAACALGNGNSDLMAGTFGDVGAFSFSPAKIVTTGQGGAVVTSKKWIEARARAMIDQGAEWRKTGFQTSIGTNLRFNDVLAALGLSQLSELPALMDRRREIFNKLSKHAWSDANVPLHNIVFHKYPARLVGRLREDGIMAERQYNVISSHPAHADLEGNYPNAEWWAERAVYLPFGAWLTDPQVNRIVEKLEELT